jgi:hypothetical protein
MRLLSLITVVLTLSIAGLGADKPCYTLVNSTNREVVLNYVPAAPGEPDNVHQFLPGAKKIFCFAPSLSVTANITNNDAKWEGDRVMVMGSRLGVLPPGTYRIVSK